LSNNKLTCAKFCRNLLNIFLNLRIINNLIIKFSIS